jgi:hypothetical protein
MFVWVSLAAVVVVVIGLAWWSSGRAKPLGRKSNQSLSQAEMEAEARRGANHIGRTSGFDSYGGPGS